MSGIGQTNSILEEIILSIDEPIRFKNCLQILRVFPKNISSVLITLGWSISSYGNQTILGIFFFFTRNDRNLYERGIRKLPEKWGKIINEKGQ